MNYSEILVLVSSPKGHEMILYFDLNVKIFTNFWLALK